MLDEFIKLIEGIGFVFQFSLDENRAVPENWYKLLYLNNEYTIICGGYGNNIDWRLTKNNTSFGWMGMDETDWLNNYFKEIIRDRKLNTILND